MLEDIGRRSCGICTCTLMQKEANDLLDVLECRWYWCGALPPLFTAGDGQLVAGSHTTTKIT
jgi:hypothetical protein